MAKVLYFYTFGPKYGDFTHITAQYRTNKSTTKLNMNDPLTPVKFVTKETIPRITNTIDMIGDHFWPLNAPLVMKIRRIPIAINTIPITALNPASMPINPPTAAVASAEPDTSTGAAPSRLLIIPCKNKNAIPARNVNTVPIMSTTASAVPCQGRVRVSIDERLNVIYFN